MRLSLSSAVCVRRPGYVPAMADGRRRSAAKQARRDARRRKARSREPVELETPEETPLIDEVRQALDGGRPWICWIW